jgi:putative transposase
MHGRKRIRLPVPFCVGRRYYFVTACTKDRLRFFNNAPLAEYAVRCLLNAATCENFLMHAWCVMPDHVHALVEGISDLSRVCQFVNHWKCKTRENFRQRNHRELWQRTFFDRTLRPEDCPYPIAWYIWLNPVRKGLCQDPTDYPFSGSMTMDWKSMLKAGEDWVPPW